MSAPTPTNEESQKVPFILPQGPFNEFATLAEADAEIVFKTPGLEVFITSESAFYYWDGSMWIKEVFAGVTTDIKVKVSATDTTAGFLTDKLSIDSTGSLVKLNPGGNEILEITINNSSAIWNADLIQGTPVDASAIANGKALVFNSVSGHIEYQTVSTIPSGPAGGDLSGTYPNPTVAKIQGVLVDNTGIANFKVLTYNSGSGHIEYQTVVAPNVTITPFPGITGPDVQSALQQLQTEITNNDKAVNVSYNNVVSGLLGTNVQDAIDELSYDTNTPNVVYVKNSNPGPGEFTSIVTAMASITTATATSQWVIVVGPGTFIEDTIIMKPYVHIQGFEKFATIIQVNATSKNVIVGSRASSIRNVRLQGATDTGLAGIYFSNTSVLVVGDNNSFVVDEVTFGNNNILVNVVGASPASGIILSKIVTNTGNFVQGFVSSNLSSVFISSSQILGSPITTDMFVASGTNSQLTLSSVLISRGGAPSGNAIHVSNGTFVKMISVDIRNYAKGIWLENVGSAEIINVEGVNMTLNTQDIVVDHPSASGFINGIFNRVISFINPSCTVVLHGLDRRIIRVSKLDTDYQSVAAAVNSITDSSITNRYVIQVGPGIYTEPLIDLSTKQYISIEGTTIEGTIIQPDANNHHIFNLGSFCELSFMTLQNTGAGFAAIAFQDQGVFGQCHKVSFYNNDIGILVTSATQDTYFYAEYVDFNNVYTYGVKIMSSAGFIAFANLENYYNFPSVTMVPDTLPIGTYLTGPQAQANVITSGHDTTSNGTGPLGGTAFYVENGGLLDIASTTIIGWKYGIRAANVGLPSIINGNSIINSQNIIYDLFIEHPSTDGTVQGVFDGGKLFIGSPELGLLIQDLVDGSLTVTNSIEILYPNGTKTDISTLIAEGSACGVIEGGILSDGGGFTVNISAGYGYFEQFPDNDVIQRFDWGNTSIVLSANVDQYIYFNSSAILTANSAEPNSKYNILLGRIVTNGSTIEIVDASQLDAEHASNSIINLLINALGPIYATGSIVSENATPLHLNVTSGQFYFGDIAFNPSGGINITFTEIFGQGSGVVTGAMAVDNTQYDVSGTLTPLNAFFYTKHSIYIVGEGVNEKYYFVYGQNQYSSLLAAQQGNIPSIPSYFRGSVTLIAGVIVQQGFANIVQVIDERPVVGFKSSGVNASADHLSLLNLNTGDAGHHQFLLLTGTTPMVGTLNMNTNSISNIVNINGIPVPNFIKIGGNTYGAPEFIGLTDNFGFSIRTNNFDRIAISNAGVVTISNLSGFGTTVIGVDNTGALITTVSTSNLTEGTNLYYTQARFDTAFGAKTTTNLTEGTNLYFTNARAIGALLTGFVAGPNSVVIATDSILQGVEKLQGQISALVTGVSSVSGTSNRITTSPTTGAVVVDIAATYVGQSSITTLGIITTGTWNATIIGLAYGGTNTDLSIGTAIGDLIQADSTTTFARLASVSAGSLLRSKGISTLSAWSTFKIDDTFSVNNIPFASAANNISSTINFKLNIIGGTNATQLYIGSGSTTAASNIYLAGQLNQFFGVLKIYDTAVAGTFGATTIPLASSFAITAGTSDTLSTTYPLIIGGASIINVIGPTTSANMATRLSSSGLKLDLGSANISTNALANFHLIGGTSFASWGATKGAQFRIDAATFTDTSATGLIAGANIASIGISTIAATNAGRTITDAATWYIEGSPIAGTNVAFTRAWSLYVAAGNVNISTVTSGTWNASPIAILYGGTGQTTQIAAFNALSPLTTKGDLIVYDGTNNVRIGVGTNNQVLTADSAQADGIKWGTPWLAQKSGIVAPGSFAGNPKTFAVVFATAFVDNNYAVTITGSDNRTWSISAKTATGFTISANANPALAGNTFWIAMHNGEA